MGRKSTRENKTIYQKLREENDLTREKAAELLEFISEDRLERIENEKSEPAPEDVIRMAEVYKAPELCTTLRTPISTTVWRIPTSGTGMRPTSPPSRTAAVSSKKSMMATW